MILLVCFHPLLCDSKFSSRSCARQKSTGMNPWQTTYSQHGIRCPRVYMMDNKFSLLHAVSRASHVQSRHMSFVDFVMLPWRHMQLWYICELEHCVGIMWVLLLPRPEWLPWSSRPFQSELQFSGFHCFTDSTVALHWILGVDKSWKPFVENRVAEIRSLFPPSCWIYNTCRKIDHRNT